MKSIFFKNKKSNTKDAARNNRRAVTFVFCLLVSIFVWVLMSLTKEYVISVSFPVKYTNLPTDKLIVNQLPEIIDIEIKSSGFNLLFYKMKQHKETIMLDINDAKSTPVKNNYFINCNNHLDKVTSQFSSAIKVIHIKPDTVFINYNKKISKTVPVKINLNIKFAEQYQQTDSIQLEPKTIEVMGTKEVLATISFVETAVTNLKKVDKAVLMDLNIVKSPAMKQVEFSQNSVKVKINVTKFTETQVELPVEVENLPNGLNLKTFPDKISVKYQVAYDDYGKINSSDFKITVDYSKIEQGSNKLKVQIVKFPTNVRSVKLGNERVEYIIRK